MYALKIDKHMVIYHYKQKTNVILGSKQNNTSETEESHDDCAV